MILRFIKLLSVFLSFALVFDSCGGIETDNDIRYDDVNKGEDNYVDLAVTGGVLEVSYTCAEIKGYANIGPLALAGVEFGVMVSEDKRPDETNSTRIKSSSLEDGREFSVLVSRSTGRTLQPETTYYYRTYVLSSGVYMLGQIESFRTLDVPESLMTVENVLEIDYSDATVEISFEPDLLHQSDSYSFGVLVTGKNGFERRFTGGRFWSEDIIRVSIDGLTAGGVYQCRPFISMGGKECLSDSIKSFTTKSADGMIRLDATYDITRVSAKNRITLDKSQLSGIEYVVDIYYSTDRDKYETGDGQQLMYWYSDRDHIGEVIIASPDHLDFGTRYYVWASLTFDNTSITTEVQTFVTKDLDTFGSVDMGGSVKWSDRNLGASQFDKVGNYYAWGEVTPRTSIGDDYKWYDYSRRRYTKYCDASNWGTVDKKYVLDPEDDAAHVSLGGKWRMPTLEEMQELNKGCVWTKTGKSGVRGLLCEADNGNALFFPCSGYMAKSGKYQEEYPQLWSASASSTPKSWCMDGLIIGYTSEKCSQTQDYRTTLRPVRPVCDK